MSLFPFFFVLFTSFKTTKEYMKNVWGFPGELFLGNYAKVFQPTFFRYFANSVFVTAVSVMLILIVASMMSYTFARIRPVWGKVIYMVVISGMMIPMHTTLIPVYMLSNEIGLYNSLFALIGPYVSFNIPISVFIMSQFFEEIPREVEEAAVIDGCGHAKIFRSMILPLSKPVLSTVGIYTGLNTWNEFSYALVLIDSSKHKTLPLGIKDFYGAEAVNIPCVMAAILVSSLPVILLYMFAQEKVISGLTQGAVKG